MWFLNLNVINKIIINSDQNHLNDSFESNLTLEN